MTSPLSETTLRESLRHVLAPGIGRSVIDLGMIQSIQTPSGGGVELGVRLPTPAYPLKDELSAALSAAIAKAFPQAGPVSVDYTWEVAGSETGGAIGLRVKNVIAVGSGKGGVGKSTMSASLAVGLKLAGARVGVMDADIYGPSIPHLFGVTGRPAIVEETSPDGRIIQRMDPIVANGIKIMSMGFLVGADDPVIVRGPILHRTIEQFLRMTAWGELDYLIIDLPPGTGDIALTLSQLLGLTGAIVVCTPQQLALLDAVKAINMFRKVKIPVLGLIENMSGEIFGRGGAQKKAAEMGVPFLGEVPIEAKIREFGDAGNIFGAFAAGSPAREALRNVCGQAALQIAKSLLETPKMPSLEIL